MEHLPFSSWLFGADMLMNSPIQSAGALVIALLISITSWRLLMTPRQPPCTEWLAGWPIPVVGPILNFLLTVNALANLDKDKPWRLVVDYKEKLGRTFR